MEETLEGGRGPPRAVVPLERERELVFHQEKNWLCWKCVIKYEVRSAIFWDFTHHRMAILTTNVLLDLKMGPVSCPETSVANQQYTLCNIPED
jgi:hypothetical protein